MTTDRTDRCIYCEEKDRERFKRVEHVILRSFGTFGSETPTLHCVCDLCNDYFKKELDQPFARDSLEGVTRYKHGLCSSESRFQKDLKMTLESSPELGAFGGLPAWVDGQTRKAKPHALAQFRKTESGEYETVLRKDLKGLDWKARGFSDQGIRLFATSDEEQEGLIRDLAEIGIQYKIGGIFKPPSITGGEITVNIEGVVDHTMKRALAKMLFNFAAYYIGYEEVMKPQWNKARRYIRSNEEPLKARASARPFWGEETDHWRFKDDSYNLRIENMDNNVVGAIQFFNLTLYEFILAEDYNISADQEVAVRFTPGETPFRVLKLSRIIPVQNRLFLFGAD